MRTWEVEMNAGINGNNPKAALDALRLYEGDIRIRDKAGNLLSRQSSDDFYKNKDAYRTLNALLFAGICNFFGTDRGDYPALLQNFWADVPEYRR